MARRRSQGTAAPRRRQAQPPANKAMPDSSRGVCPAFFRPVRAGILLPSPARDRPCPMPVWRPLSPPPGSSLSARRPRTNRPRAAIRSVRRAASAQFLRRLRRQAQPPCARKTCPIPCVGFARLVSRPVRAAAMPPSPARGSPTPRAGFARLFSVPCAQASCCRPRRGTAPAPCRYSGRFPRRHRAPTCAACSSHPGRFSIACYRTGPPPARANGWSRMRRIAPPAHISGLGGKTVQSSGKNKPPFFRNAAAGSANRGAGSRFCTPYAPAPAARRTAIPAGAQKPKPRRRPSTGGAGAGAISRRTQ